MHYEFLVDRAERPQKCSILPLEGREDFHIRRFDRGRPIAALQAELLLHIDGESLDKIDVRGVQSIACVDCHWRRCSSIVRMIEAPLPRLVRIPPGFKTAYPRRNKHEQDPPEGLATIEAVFIAAAFCGIWDPSLLARYHWRVEFLTMNQPLFESFGIYGATQQALDPGDGL